MTKQNFCLFKTDDRKTDNIFLQSDEFVHTCLRHYLVLEQNTINNQIKMRTKIHFINFSLLFRRLSYFRFQRRHIQFDLFR